MDNEFNRNDGTDQDNGNSYFNNTAQTENSSSYSEYEYTADETVENNGKANGFQIASLVLGIIGIVVCCCYGVPSLILGGLGLAFAIIGNGRNKGNGVGTAGLVCSIIALVLGAISTVYYIFVIVSIANGGNSEYNRIMQEYLNNVNK